MSDIAPDPLTAALRYADHIKTLPLTDDHAVIVTLADALKRVSLQNAQLLEDRARLDWLEKNFPKLAAQVSGNAISTPPLREAIDAARKEAAP